MDLFRTNEYLARGVDAMAMREQVIANNLAHINDPNYQGQVVNFEDRMQEAINQWNDGETDTERDEGETEAANCQAEVEAAPPGRSDMNTEMANLAKAQILYSAMTSQVGGNFKSLKYVIDNSGH